jgi:putative hydrolase of the HAD superfamily
MDEIKAVIFDWGGVLIDDPAPGMMEYCAKTFNVTTEKYTNAHNIFARDFQKGLISEQKFWALVAGELNLPNNQVGSLWYEAFSHVYTPKPEMFELAQLLKQNGYKTAVLSNTELPAVKYFREQNYDMFDVTVFSCQEGAVKPQRGIYEVAIQRLAAEPSEVVFFDDKPQHVSGAVQAGLVARLFDNISRAENFLNRLGVNVENI